MEPLDQWKKGWMETCNDTYPKVTQLVDFRVIPAAETYVTMDSRNYFQTGLEHPPIAALMAKLLHAETPDLFNGKLMLGTVNPLQKGQYLEIRLNLHRYECQVRFLAEAVFVKQYEEMKERVYSAGIDVVAVHRKDMELFDGLVEAKKSGG